MKRGEIWWVDLNPVKGREQAGRRPVLVISGNLLNEHTDIVIVCPLTSKLKRYHGNLILSKNKTNGLEKTSEVLTWQVRAISKNRLVDKVGEIAENDVLKVHHTLNQLLKF